jgi:hypothetical protein
MGSKRIHKKSRKGSRKTKKQHGGSACAAARNGTQVGGGSKPHMTQHGGSACAAAKQLGGSACAAARNGKQLGGSLASSFVEDYANLNAQRQPLDEYQKKAGLPGMNNLKGGGCGCSGRASYKRSRKQRGGSAASNRVMSALQHTPDTFTDYKAPKLYSLTGGARRKKSSKKQMGGSFWNLAGYGNINAGEAMFKNDHYFTKDTSHPSWKDLMDPPSKEKAGSGDKQDLAVGASYPFA